MGAVNLQINKRAENITIDVKNVIILKIYVAPPIKLFHIGMEIQS